MTKSQLSIVNGQLVLRSEALLPRAGLTISRGSRFPSPVPYSSSRSRGRHADKRGDLISVNLLQPLAQAHQAINVILSQAAFGRITLIA